MATVLSTGQKIGGVVVASCILFIGLLCLVGGVVGWFKHGTDMISEKQELRLEQEDVEEAPTFLERPNDFYNSGQSTHESRSSYSLKGEKGDRGPRGPPGLTVRGPEGPPGPPGLPGPGIIGGMSLSGEDICGCNQTIMRQYIKEMKPLLIPGPPGNPGPPGSSTYSDRSTTGLKGDKGDRGERGDPGPEGLIGTKGEPGRDGLPGLPGPPGPPSSPMYAPPMKYDELGWGKSLYRSDNPKFSPIYLPNIVSEISKGDTGAQGPPGPQGPRGDSGSKGDRGHPGLQGQKGEQGYEGPAGQPGQRGETGAPGRDGAPGFPGQIGRPGEKGERGEPGVPIPMSMTGDLAAIKGDKGDIGPQGPPGRTSIINCNDNRNPWQFDSSIAPCSGGLTIVGKYSDLTSLSVADGTLVYITSEERLVLKRTKTWTVIQLGQNLLLGPSQVPKNLLAVDETTKSSNEKYQPKLDPSQLSTLRLISLNSPRNGALYGAQGVDHQCYRQARQSNIQGTFRAFLAPSLSQSVSIVEQSGRSLESIVRYRDRDLPVVNLKGEMLFPSWKAIFESGGSIPKKSAIYSFNGKNVLTNSAWRHKEVWHGVNPWGESSHINCDGWNTENPLQVGLAADLRNGLLLHQKKVSCSQELVVLCIETFSHTIYSS